MTDYFYAHQLRIFDYPQWLRPLCEAIRKNMERLAAENDIEIEFATDVLHAINRDIAEPNYADRSLSGCTADVDGLRLANAVG